MRHPFLRQWRAMPDRIRSRIALGAAAGSATLAALAGITWAAVGGPAAAGVLAMGLLASGALSQIFVPQWSWLVVSRCSRQDCLALTFDDGPDPRITPRLLDLLARHGATATFFVLGSRAEAHPDLIRRAAWAGHELAVHGQTHRQVWKLSTQTFQQEVAKAETVVADLAGRRPRWYRAPHGFLRPDQARWLIRQGLRPAGWSIGIWDTDEQADPGTLARRLHEGVQGGDILLLHDGVADRDRPQEAMLAALAEVLPHWVEAGLQVTTLTRALEADSELEADCEAGPTEEGP